MEISKNKFEDLLKEKKIKNNTVIKICVEGCVCDLKYISGKFYEYNKSKCSLGETISINRVLKLKNTFEILGVEIITNNFNDILSSFGNKKIIFKSLDKYFHKIGDGEFNKFLNFQTFLSNVAYYLSIEGTFKIFNSKFSVIEFYDIKDK